MTFFSRARSLSLSLSNAWWMASVSSCVCVCVAIHFYFQSDFLCHFLLTLRWRPRERSETRNIVSLVICSIFEWGRTRMEGELMCRNKEHKDFSQNLLKRPAAPLAVVVVVVVIVVDTLRDVCVYFIEYNGFSFPHRKVLILFGHVLCFGKPINGVDCNHI